MERSGVRWREARRRLPNAFEGWCLLLLAGALWYVPRALARPGGMADPAFVGPFRGGTRSVGCLMRGDFWRALEFNPLAVLLMLVLLVGALRWLVVLALGRRPVLELTRRGRAVLWSVVLVILAAGWGYVLMSESWRQPYG
jgi:hypothetical protein